MQESIFTQIINGTIPAHRVYEDGNTLAFLDIHPTQPGHTLVVPKVQVEFLWDLSDADYEALMSTVKKVARHLRTTLNAPYVGMKVIGVDVPHAHIHLIPFTTVAEYDMHPDTAAEPDHGALAAMAATLRMED